MRYEDVADLIPGLVDGTVEVDDRTRAFIDSDLRCQAELARYRRLLRGPGRAAHHLSGTRARAVSPRRSTPWRPRASGGSPAAILSGRRVVVAGAALGGAAVAGAATAAVIAARSRRRLLAG